MAIDKAVKDEIWNAALETIENSTIHGFTSLVKNKHIPVKIMWLFCILGSAGYCWYSIALVIMQYFEFQVVTQVNINYVNELPFPIVKICRSDLGITSDPGIDGSTVTNKVSLLENQNYLQNVVKTSNSSLQKTLGIPDMNQVIVTCVYNFLYCNLTEMFDYYYDFHYGNCFRFNAGKNMAGETVPFQIATQTGGYNGLELEMYVGKASENDNLYSFDNGYNILVSNESIDSTLREGVKIGTGLSLYIAVNQYTISLQPKPYSECTAGLKSADSYDSICYKKTFVSAASQSKNYHYSDCSLMCFQKYLGEQCQCQDTVTDAYYPSLRKCIKTSDLACYYKSLNEYSGSAQLIHDCDCPLECERTDYYLGITYADYPTAYYATLLYMNPVIQEKFPNISTLKEQKFYELKDSITSICVFYNELKQTIISHDIKMVPSDLLAFIGGNLGLFLGVSLLSFIEFFEVIIQSVLILIRSKNKKGKVSSSTTQLFTITESNATVKKDMIKKPVFNNDPINQV